MEYAVVNCHRLKFLMNVCVKNDSTTETSTLQDVQCENLTFVITAAACDVKAGMLVCITLMTE